MSDYSSFAKPVDDYSSFAKPVEDYSSFAKPVEEELSWYQSDKSIPEQALDMARGIPTSIGKLTSTIEKGMGELGATVQDTLGFQDAADAQRRKAQQDYEANLKRVEERFGKVSTPAGEVVEGVGQGLGLVGAMALNPVVGGAAALGPYLMGSSTQVVKDLGDKGVSPEATTRAAQMQVAGNAVLGLIPGAGPIRGALMNWATGQLSDMATYEYLVQNGYKEAADVVIGKRGIVDKQGLIDVLVGGVGGRIESKANQAAQTPQTVSKGLDAVDAKNEELKRTQGEGTLYVGQTGDVTPELPRKVTETPEQIDLARTELQNQLQQQATAREEPPQGELFPKDPVTGEPTQIQENLDLRTAPPEQGNVGVPVNASVDFDGRRGTAGNESVLAGLAKIKETDDIALDNPERVGAIAITGIDLQAGGQKGRASEVLKQITDWADSTGQTLVLMPSGSGNISNQGLRNWYARNGFKLEADGAMVRKAAPIPAEVKPAAGATGELIIPDDGGTVNRLVNIQKLNSYDKATGEFNPIEYLTTMRDTHVEGKSRAYKAVYDLILKAVNKMPESARPRFALDIDVLTGKPRELTSDRTGNKAEDAPGLYDPNTDTVWIGRRGENEGTLVHETIHGLTSRVLHIYKPSHTLVKGLYRIYDSVKNDPAFKGEYGLTDIHEFIAEVFSSPSFQAKLAQHQVKGLVTSAKNTLHAIVKEIVTALGYRTTSPEGRVFTNALEELVFHSEKLIDTYAENKQFFDNAFKEKFPASKNVSGLPARRGQTEKSIDLITDGAVGVSRAAQSPPKVSDPEVAKSNKIEELSGETYIPKNPTIDEDLINKIRGEKDGSGTWNLTPGALARSELAQSTLVKTIYRLMDGAYKRAEYKINKAVKPAQETFMKILRNPTKAAISHEILMRELKKGTDYTADELRSVGVSDDLIKAHLEFRAMMQEALEAQNAQLRDKGLPTVKALDAYISSRWSGPWRANIKDAEGNTVWQVAEHSRSEADKAIKYILAKQPNLKADDLKYRKGFEKGDNVEAGYLDMLNMLDPDDPRVAALKSVYEEYLLGTTQDVASQEKHFLSKKGVRGFAGDRKWSNTDVRDFFVQQFAYAENAFRWSEAQKSMVDVKKLLNNEDLQDSQKNNIKYSKEYVKGQLGFGKNEAFEAIDNGLARMAGLSPQKLQEYMGAAKTFFYLSKLGLSVPFTITQFLQPAITTPGWHAQLDSIGYKHNPIVSTFKSMYGGAQAALWHYGQFFNSPELSKAAEKTMSKLDIEAAKYMEANGVIDINPMTDIKKGLRPRAVGAVAAPFEFTIKHSEVVARSIAFMGFVSHLQQSGKYDTKTQKGRLELFQKAEDLTSLSMTDYRTQERALAFEKMGLAGDAAATLHSYQINNLMQLVKFGKEASNGNVTPLFYMVAMQGLAAGLTGLWFVDDLDDMLDNIKKLMPHDQYMKVKDFSIKNLILNNLPDWAAYGGVSAVTGTNIHTRLNASNQIPVWPFESKEDPVKNILGLAPFVESTFDVGAGVLKAVSPGSTQQERMAGLYQAAPTVAQGPMENLPAFSDAGVSLKPKDLSQGKIRRTEEEKNLRNYGFKSVREQKQSDTEFQLSKVERELQARIQQSSNKAVQSFISKDPEKGVEHLIRYVELGGDPQTLVNRIPQAKIDRVTTELERRALKAGSGTRPAILKLQRYMQAVPR